MIKTLITKVRKETLKELEVTSGISKSEREIKAKKIEECYKKLTETLAETYGVPPPKVEFSWKLYTDFGPGASYSFKEHDIRVTYDTRPDELIHEFKHYLQDIVEKRDYDKEWEELVWNMYKKTGVFTRIWERGTYHPLEQDADRFSKKYARLLESEGRKIYGSVVWITSFLRDKFREGEIPEFVITVLRKKLD